MFKSRYTITKAAVSSVFCLLISGVAVGHIQQSPEYQVNPFDEYRWWLYPGTITVDVDTSVPAACSQSVVDASSKWNGLSNFNVNGYTFTSNPDDHPDIKVRFGEPSNNEFVGEIRAEGSVDGWTHINNYAVPIFQDVTITMNDDLWMMGELSCSELDAQTWTYVNNPAPNQYNADNTITHEIGHAAGLEHLGGPTCVMESGTIRGEPTFSSFCSQETTAMGILH